MGWFDYVVIFWLPVGLLIEYLIARWARGNEAQRLLDGFRLKPDKWKLLRDIAKFHP
jgi:hypothetical protein